LWAISLGPPAAFLGALHDIEMPDFSLLHVAVVLDLLGLSVLHQLLELLGQVAVLLEAEELNLLALSAERIPIVGLGADGNSLLGKAEFAAFLADLVVAIRRTGLGGLHGF